MAPITYVAILTPKPEKAARFAALAKESCAHALHDGPGTIQFQLIEEEAKDDPKSPQRYMMLEMYASQQAMDAHFATDHHHEVFRVLKEEDLLVGPPAIFKGSAIGGFRFREA